MTKYSKFIGTVAKKATVPKKILLTYRHTYVTQHFMFLLEKIVGLILPNILSDSKKLILNYLKNYFKKIKKNF